MEQLTMKLETILEVDKEVWKQEVSGIEEFYAKMAEKYNW